jgi:hypothetical protein
VEQQNEFAWKIFIVCFHVGQMLFAGNKYLLLKRITVQSPPRMTSCFYQWRKGTFPAIVQEHWSKACF